MLPSLYFWEEPAEKTGLDGADQPKQRKANGQKTE
jgi:hypothetical protein